MVVRPVGLSGLLTVLTTTSRPARGRVAGATPDVAVREVRHSGEARHGIRVGPRYHKTHDLVCEIISVSPGIDSGCRPICGLRSPAAIVRCEVGSRTLAVDLRSRSPLVPKWGNKIHVRAERNKKRG